MDQGSPQPGWYADPEQPGQLRYWDGNAWTQHRSPAPGQAAAPQQAVHGGGYPAQGQVPQARIDTWLWQSIVATILCCLPLGIVAIVFSSQAQSAINFGDYATGQQKAKLAKNFTLISVGIGLVFIVGWMLLFFGGIAAGI